PSPTDVRAAADPGHLLLVVLIALTALQAAFVFVRVPVGPRIAGIAVVALLVVGLALSPLALRGHVRTAYWHVAAKQAAAQPVLGSGAGTFVDWWLRLRTVPRSTQEAHSLYLETVAELGPLGLALLLAVFAFPFAAAWRLRHPPALAALTVYVLAAAVDFHW